MIALPRQIVSAAPRFARQRWNARRLTSFARTVEPEPTPAWLSLSSDVPQAVVASQEAVARLHEPQLTGTGLAVLLATQALAGNFSHGLFAKAFSDDVLRSKVFRVEDQALLYLIDTCLSLYADGSAFGSTQGPESSVQKSECTARLPMDVSHRCERAAATVSAATLPVHAVVQTLMSRCGTAVVSSVKAGAIHVPLALAAKNISIEVSGPWNRSLPMDGNEECSKGNMPSLAELGLRFEDLLTSHTMSSHTASQANDERHHGNHLLPLADVMRHRRHYLQLRRDRSRTSRKRRAHRQPSLLSRLTEVNLAAVGWSVHRIYDEDISSARFADSIRAGQDDTDRGTRQTHQNSVSPPSTATRSTAATTVASTAQNVKPDLPQSSQTIPRAGAGGVWGSPTVPPVGVGLGSDKRAGADENVTQLQSPAVRRATRNSVSAMPVALQQSLSDPMHLLPQGIAVRSDIAAGLSASANSQPPHSTSALTAMVNAEVKIALSRHPHIVRELVSQMRERSEIAMALNSVNR